MSQEIKCSSSDCKTSIYQSFWDKRYQNHQTGWDLGQVSPPLKDYFDAITNKSSRILIPGCGNAYEAQYLISNGFTNITVIDISPTLVHQLKSKFQNNSNIKVVLGDFFEHQGVYDLIFEQTFFCAIPPFLRSKYVWKMHQLLASKGKLVGLLFNRDFTESPPFGGSKSEYERLFQKAFQIQKLETAQNSIPARASTELFFEFDKNESVDVNLYHFQGITCMGCVKTISEKFSGLNGILQVSMTADFANVLIVSTKNIPLSALENEISYDPDYKISLIKQQI